MTVMSMFVSVLGIGRRNFPRVLLNPRYLCKKMSQPLDKIPDVDIDADGVFKYILINLHDDANKQLKPIVRGYSRAQWHADIYDETSSKVQKDAPGLETECVGGGRIQHDAGEKRIKVYGFSQGFGKADHKVTVGLLKKKYPDYEITWSDEGY